MFGETQKEMLPSEKNDTERVVELRASMQEYVDKTELLIKGYSDSGNFFTFAQGISDIDFDVKALIDELQALEYRNKKSE